MNNYTPLMYASQNGNCEIVKHLIENQANIDAKNYKSFCSMLPKKWEYFFGAGGNK